MTLAAFCGDTHGHLKCMWDTAVAWEERTGLKLEFIFQVGDFGIFPTIEQLDPSSARHAKRHGYSLEVAVGDFPAVILGDLEVPIPTYFIRGNHEDQRFLMSHEKRHQQVHKKKGAYLNLPIELCPNLFYVPDGHVITLNDTRIAGLGGCWGKKTWEMEYWSEVRATENKKGYARRLNHVTRDRWERLMRSQFDILVTHDAPSHVGLHGSPGGKPVGLDDEPVGNDGEQLGMPQIRELIETVQPRYQFGGHWHEFQKNQIGDTTAYVLDKVVPGEVDKRWMEVVELTE